MIARNVRAVTKLAKKDDICGKAKIECCSVSSTFGTFSARYNHTGHAPSVFLNRQQHCNKMDPDDRVNISDVGQSSGWRDPNTDSTGRMGFYAGQEKNSISLHARPLKKKPFQRIGGSDWNIYKTTKKTSQPIFHGLLWSKKYGLLDHIKFLSLPWNSIGKMWRSA